VCAPCRPHLTPYQQKVLTILWHDIICERAYVSAAERYRCHHCWLYFFRSQVCGDHWPHTKAARPDLRFDITNGVCACAGCNTSGNKKRKTVKNDRCVKCKIRLPVHGDWCIICR
jgi:hypothetical protein